MAFDIIPALNLHPRAKRFQTFKCITCRSTVKALLKTHTYAARCPKCSTRFTVSPAGTVCFQQEKPSLLGEETRETKALKIVSGSPKTQIMKTAKGFSTSPQTRSFPKEEIPSQGRDSFSTSKTRSIQRASLARLVESEADEFPVSTKKSSGKLGRVGSEQSLQTPTKKSSGKLKKATTKKSSGKLGRVGSEQTIQTPAKKSSGKLGRAESEQTIQTPAKKSSGKLGRAESEQTIQTPAKKSSGKLGRIRTKDSSGKLKKNSSQESSRKILSERGQRKYPDPNKGKVQRVSRMDVAPKSESELWHSLGLNVMSEIDQVEKYLSRTTQRVKAIEADIVDAFAYLEKTKINRSRKAGLMIFLMILPLLVGAFFLLSAIPNQGFTTKGEMKKHLTEQGQHLREIFRQEKP